MNTLLHVLLYTAVLGTVTSTVYCGMVLVAAIQFGRLRRQDNNIQPDFFPPISVLKPLHGAEPGLEQNLESFFDQVYPEFELIFCARQADDAGLQLAERIGLRYPDVRARYITCGEPEYPNAKMWSLAALARAARYETLVTADADARVQPSYLQHCVQGLKDGTDLESCVYVGTTDGGLVAELDAVGKTVEMTAGVLVAQMLEGARFALGVTMVLRRESFALAAGYDELGQYWAEDFVLGNRLADKGFGVRISRHVIRLIVPPMGFWESFRNQIRWMKSTRRSRPAGHFGTGLTFAVPFGLMGLVWCLANSHVLLGLVWVLAILLNRWVMAGGILWALGEAPLSRAAWIYPLRDLLGGVLWVGSYCGSTLHYHGGLYRLEPGGRFRRHEG